METLNKFIAVAKKKNYDSVDDAELKEFIENIKNNKDAITYIGLAGNSYSKEFCEKFGALIKECPKLTHLNLNDCFVGRKKDEVPFALESLTKPLIDVGKLVAIDLSNNAVSVNGSTAISGFLEKTVSLKVFLINNCGLGILGSTIIADALKKGKIDLEVIAMARNRLENDGTKAIASALKEMPSIKGVHLYQDVIRKDGMVPLLEALMDKKLETLDVSDNFINEESVDTFCKFLESCETLKNLNVSDCNIQEDDNEKIVDALEKSKSKIVQIGYNHNELLEHDLAVRFVDTLLEKNPEISRVDIRGNEFRKKTKTYYAEKFDGKEGLSQFESDDEDDDGEPKTEKEFIDLNL